MPTLHIEHAVPDFDAWKAAFERDPAGRQRSGVRRYRVLRAADDPNLVVIDLDFDTREEVDAFLAVMRTVWQTAQAAPSLISPPQTRIFEQVMAEAY